MQRAIHILNAITHTVASLVHRASLRLDYLEEVWDFISHNCFTDNVLITRLVLRHKVSVWWVVGGLGVGGECPLLPPRPTCSR
jgi:hypothetical protein